jgi:hypothetical protein
MVEISRWRKDEWVALGRRGTTYSAIDLDI